jgi:hypothetical protein
MTRRAACQRGSTTCSAAPLQQLTAQQEKRPAIRLRPILLASLNSLCNRHVQAWERDRTFAPPDSTLTGVCQVPRRLAAAMLQTQAGLRLITSAVHRTMRHYRRGCTATAPTAGPRTPGASNQWIVQHYRFIAACTNASNVDRYSGTLGYAPGREGPLNTPQPRRQAFWPRGDATARRDINEDFAG